MSEPASTSKVSTASLFRVAEIYGRVIQNPKIFTVKVEVLGHEIQSVRHDPKRLLNYKIPALEATRYEQSLHRNPEESSYYRLFRS